jgi:hypothetical protein
MPVNAVAIAAGDIRTVEQAAELGIYLCIFILW